MTTGCHYCGTTDGLRPYGPGGSPICFPCMKATPEREATAHNALGALIGAAEAASPHGVAVIGTDEGPMPLHLPLDRHAPVGATPCAQSGHAWRNDGAIPLVCDTCGHAEAGR